MKVMGRSEVGIRSSAELHVVASRGRTGEHLVCGGRRAIRRSNPEGEKESSRSLSATMRVVTMLGQRDSSGMWFLPRNERRPNNK